MHQPSERQRQILRAVRDHVEARAWPPTIAELAEATGIPWSTVKRDLITLAEAGYLYRGDGARCIALTDAAVDLVGPVELPDDAGRVPVPA